MNRAMRSFSLSSQLRVAAFRQQCMLLSNILWILWKLRTKEIFENHILLLARVARLAFIMTNMFALSLEFESTWGSTLGLSRVNPYPFSSWAFLDAQTPPNQNRSKSILMYHSKLMAMVEHIM